ncbi:hypothetical protein HJB89_10725 [Rhizobium sp. NZLR8]|nr:hypothetical protein [Rhizobium sp. NZLR8]
MDEVAEYIQMSRKSLAGCENGSDATLTSIAALRNFYDKAGIEFLGVYDLTTREFYGSGVCWKPRTLLGRAALRPLPVDDANFFAARALLGLSEEQVARESKLAERQIENLENGRRFTAKGYKQLREYFEDEKHMEFLCATMTDARNYLAAGVRIASKRAPLPSRLWVKPRAG